MLGCQPEPIVPDDLMPAARPTPTDAPTYAELVTKYNRNLEHLDRLWARTDVTVRWEQEDGKIRREDGEGNLLYVAPSRVALTVGKLGHTLLWAGGDDRRFWLFDLQDEGVAYVGSHRWVGAPGSTPLPLPIHPRDVPGLMGWLPLPAPRPGDPGVVEPLRGYWLVDPPGRRVRLLLDPQTARPVRIDLTDAAGHSLVVCRLDEHRLVDLAGIDPGQRPIIATSADLYVIGREARLTLSLRQMSDGDGGRRIKDRAFDFEALRRAHKPGQVVDLDPPDAQ